MKQPRDLGLINQRLFNRFSVNLAELGLGLSTVLDEIVSKCEILIFKPIDVVSIGNILLPD